MSVRGNVDDPFVGCARQHASDNSAGWRLG